MLPQPRQETIKSFSISKPQKKTTGSWQVRYSISSAGAAALERMSDNLPRPPPTATAELLGGGGGGGGLTRLKKLRLIWRITPGNVALRSSCRLEGQLRYMESFSMSFTHWKENGRQEKKTDYMGRLSRGPFQEEKADWLFWILKIKSIPVQSKCAALRHS